MNEEQEMEVEALQAIYMDEIELLSECDPCKFKLCLQPEGVMDEDTTCMCVTMIVELPTAYPDEIPIIELESERGVTDEECAELTESLIEMANENVGMQMIFTLASHVQEWMIEMQQKEEDRRFNPTEEEQIAEIKRLGTAVTRENFLEWKKIFDAEMAPIWFADHDLDRGLTGRQLFETDSSLFEEEEEVFVEDSSLFE